MANQTSFWNKVQGFIAKAESIAQKAVADIRSLFGYAEKELPQLQKVLSVVAGVAPALFPAAAGVESFIAAIADGVQFAEKLVRTVDGVVMSPDQAATIGVEVTGNASGAQKQTAMQNFVRNAGFDSVPASTINLYAEPHVALANAATHAADKPATS